MVFTKSDSSRAQPYTFKSYALYCLNGPDFTRSKIVYIRVLRKYFFQPVFLTYQLLFFPAAWYHGNE